MSEHWEEDWEPPIGYFEDEPNDGVQCNRCKAEGLEWEQRGGKWVLIEPSGDQHFCSAFNQTIGDFEEIK